MNRIFCPPLLRTVMAMALVVLGVGLSGCADMSDTVGLAFADPAKYDLYNCKQLETERKTLATKAAELQGLMAKAQIGVAGPGVGVETSWQLWESMGKCLASAEAVGCAQ
jgi:hypothetical protein